MSRVLKSKKTFFSPVRIVAVVIVLIAVVVFYPIASGSRVDKAKLYKSAQADINVEDYEGAVESLKKIVDLDPNYKDAKKELVEAKKGLFEQAKNSLAAGDLANAETRADALDPNDSDVPKLIEDIKKAKDEEGNDTSNPDGDTNTGGGDDPSGNGDAGGGNGGGGPGAKEIGDDMVPIDVLPQSMAGYKIIQNGWLIEPHQAGSTFIPRDRAVREEIDRIIFTVAKHEDSREAKERYDSEKEIFAVDDKNININNHSAYFGLYNESKPDIFPPIARIMWTRQQWFFNVDVLPKGSPSISFKKQIAEDIVEKILY